MEAPSGAAIRLEEVYTKELGKQLCQHGEAQRGFICTATNVELELALDRGYRITRMYTIYHWEEWSNTLLRPYVQDMMRLKIQVFGTKNNHYF